MNFKAAKPDARILILQIVAAAILSFWFKNQWTTICFFLVIDLLVLFWYGAKIFLERLIAYAVLNALIWGLLILEIPIISVVFSVIPYDDCPGVSNLFAAETSYG